MLSIVEKEVDTLKDFINKRIISINLNDKSMEIVDYASEDLLDVDQAILFLTGPLTKSNLACGGRFNILAKRPKNGHLSISNSGGLWGRRLAYAGFDGLLIRGKSPNPVRIILDGRKGLENIEILDAGDLWTKPLIDINKDLRNLYGNKSSSFYIGPGGEKNS